MKSLAFFNKQVFPKDLVKTSHSFILDGVHCNVGIIEEEDTELANSDNPSKSVLVKKNAFSCGYRDKALILYVNRKITEGNSSNDNLFSHIGSEFVGEVIEVGNEVENLKVGDKVIPNVSYPSYNNKHSTGIPSNGVSKRLEVFNSGDLLKVPNDIPDTFLAAFPVSSFTAYSMIRRLAINSRSKVLVTAAKSSTSLSVMSALRTKNVDVYAMTSNNIFEKELLDLGVKEVLVVNSNKDFQEYYLDEIISRIGRFDAIIDPFFDVYFQKVIDLIAVNGKYITCGLSAQSERSIILDNNIDYKDLFIKLMINNISIIGNCIGLEEDGLNAIDDYRNGKYQISIDSVFGFNQEHLFIEKSFDFKNKFGKVIYKYAD